MTVTDEFLTNNESYAAGFGKGDLAMPPAKHVAVLACMDARLDRLAVARLATRLTRVRCLGRTRAASGS